MCCQTGTLRILVAFLPRSCLLSPRKPGSHPLVLLAYRATWHLQAVQVKIYCWYQTHGLEAAVCRYHCNLRSLQQNQTHALLVKATTLVGSALLSSCVQDSF